jgi:tRNA G10  N-methylase Trm11
VPEPTDLADERFALCARFPDNGLVGAECRSLTGGSPDLSGVAVCDRTDRVERGAYVQQGLRTIAAAPSFDELIERVAATEFDAHRFRIDIHDPYRLASWPTADMSMMLADGIPFSPDLKHPVRRFVVTVADGAFRFGEVVAESENSHRVHDDKPWTTSSSLTSQFARALVNLVPDARSIVDPCCGAGSIVLEAASLGLTAIGADWKPAMVGMTTKNLEHFGHEPSVVKADSRQEMAQADAVVTDLPYGQAITRDEAVVRGILQRAATAAPLGVFVAHRDITDWLTDAGYHDVEVVPVLKRKRFTRWVHRASCSL